MQTRILFFLKGGKGSGNFGHSGRPHRVGGSGETRAGEQFFPSDSITSLQEAQKYYKDRLSGVWSFVVNRKAGLYRVKVNFNENADHAYTKTNDLTGMREFEPVRAKLMPHVIGTIANPGKILMNGNRDLFIERLLDGNHYVVVLEWKDIAKEYRFRSAHYWDKDEFNANKKRYARPLVRGGKVQKNEAPRRLSKSSGASDSTFPVYDPSRVGSGFPKPGETPSKEGSCRPRDLPSVRYLADLVKADFDGWLEIFP